MYPGIEQQLGHLCWIFACLLQHEFDKWETQSPNWLGHLLVMLVTLRVVNWLELLDSDLTQWFSLAKLRRLTLTSSTWCIRFLRMTLRSITKAERTVDFKSTLLIMTSNVGEGSLLRRCIKSYFVVCVSQFSLVIRKQRFQSSFMDLSVRRLTFYHTNRVPRLNWIQNFRSSQIHGSVRNEILSAWRIIAAYFFTITQP